MKTFLVGLLFCSQALGQLVLRPSTKYAADNVLEQTNAAPILANLSAPRYVSTFADLAACGTDEPSVVEILGRTSAGDGGGGKFLRVAASTYATNNGTVANGTGCQFVRKDWLLNTNLVYATWFGAIGDGVTDDSTAIRNATRAADTVLLSRGTYYLGGASSGFALTNPRLKLIGENPYDTILTNAGTDTIIELATNGVFEFRNLQFKGAGRGIQNTLPSTVASSGSVLVDNCRFITNYYYPLEISGTTTAWYTNDVMCNVTVRNSYFEGFNPPGIYPAFNLYGHCFDSVLIEDCNFYRIRVGQIGNFSTGIDGLWAGLKQKRVTISGCTIDENYGSWELTSGVINIFAGLATVQNCDIKKIANQAVYITPTIYHNGPRLHVLNNVLDDFGSVGVYTKSAGWAPSGTAADYQGAFANIIAGNVFRCSASSNAYYGVIHCSGFEYLVEDNTLEECYAQFGIYTLTGLKNSRIIGNHLYGGMIDYPIYINDDTTDGYCEKVDVDHNTIQGLRRIAGATTTSGAIMFYEKTGNLPWSLISAKRNKLIDLTDWRYGIVATSDNTVAGDIQVWDNDLVNAGDLYGVGIGPAGAKYTLVDVRDNRYSHTNTANAFLLVSTGTTNRNIQNNTILSGTNQYSHVLRIGHGATLPSTTAGSIVTTGTTARAEVFFKLYGADATATDWTRLSLDRETVKTYDSVFRLTNSAPVADAREAIVASGYDPLGKLYQSISISAPLTQTNTWANLSSSGSSLFAGTSVYDGFVSNATSGANLIISFVTNAVAGTEYTLSGMAWANEASTMSSSVTWSNVVWHTPMVLSTTPTYYSVSFIAVSAQAPRFQRLDRNAATDYLFASNVTLSAGGYFGAPNGVRSFTSKTDTTKGWRQIGVLPSFDSKAVTAVTDWLPSNTETLVLVPDADHILTSTPMLLPGVQIGQVLRLTGANASSVTLTDLGTLTGSGLKVITGTNIVITTNVAKSLLWNGTSWVEF